jgi:CO/xanthine dehydrogenase Mo-binding subunit
VSVYVGSAQIAADTLGLPLGQVRVLHGSTPFLDEGYGAFASRSTVLGGSAVFEAAIKKEGTPASFRLKTARSTISRNRAGRADRSRCPVGEETQPPP